MDDDEDLTYFLALCDELDQPHRRMLLLKVRWFQLWGLMRKNADLMGLALVWGTLILTVFGCK